MGELADLYPKDWLEKVKPKEGMELSARKDGVRQAMLENKAVLGSNKIFTAIRNVKETVMAMKEFLELFNQVWISDKASVAIRDAQAYQVSSSVVAVTVLTRIKVLKEEARVKELKANNADANPQRKYTQEQLRSDWLEVHPLVVSNKAILPKEILDDFFGLFPDLEPEAKKACAGAPASAASAAST